MAEDGVTEAEQRRRSRLGALTIIAALLAILVGAAIVAWRVWREMAAAVIGPHGLAALAIGATVTLLLGVGLMALVFFSSRRGYDDEAGRD